LKTLHDVEVDNVNVVSPVEGFEDGLVGSEVCEFDEGGDVVENLESAVNGLVVNQRRANTEPGVDNSTGHGFGEIGYDSLGARLAIWGSHLG
jgi:hypothetical protein